ncbi:MAG: signal peptidase I [Clostridia bacterium]
MKKREIKERKQFKIGRYVFSWVEEVILCTIVVVIIMTFLFKLVMISGVSMLPNFEDGDRVVISCINFSYEQGDVVVISGVLDDPIIKRVIATEGQTVDIDFENGVVYVDDEAIDENFFGIENGITKETYTSLDLIEFPATVPEGHVFVLGDNRTNSEDSRYVEVGMVDERKIIGKAVLRLFPLDRFGFLD